MDESIQLSQGSHIRIGANEYRIIYMLDNVMTLCLLNTTKLDLSYWSAKEIFKSIQNGKAEILQDEEHIVSEEDLSEAVRGDFIYKKQVMQRIADVYGPDFMLLMGKRPSPLIDEIVNEKILSRTTVRRLIVRYLQSGLKAYSLLDGRMYLGKRGVPADYKTRTGKAAARGTGIPLTKEVRSYFSEALAKYMNQNHPDSVDTLKGAYDWMIFEHYSSIEYQTNGTVKHKCLPCDQRPSLRQFRYYAGKVLSEEQKRTIKTSAREYRNNERLRLGSSETNVFHAYDMVEMDAVEFDISLVDEDNRKHTVGRPIIYLMKDVATRMIIAASIGFDNNSIVGLTNCFANLNENKKALCAQYGIALEDPKLWLTGYKPRRMRYDNGSDFISKRVETLCRELNIQRDLVPPAGGSFKAVIERSFHDAHQKLNDAFRGYGRISAEYGSRHHEEATLSIYEFTKIFYGYVLSYNRGVNTGLKLSKDMILQDIPQIPWQVMQYYLSLHKPQTLPSGDEYLKILLIPANSSLSGDGITVNHLNYLNMDDEDLVEEMRKLNRKRIKFSVLYDPRTVNTIYYVKEAKLLRAKLNLNYGNQRSFQNMTVKQVEDIYKRAKETQRIADEEDLQNRIDLMLMKRQVVAEGKEKKEKGKSDSRNMRENRENAKQKRSYQQSLEGRIGTPDSASEQAPNSSDNVKKVVQPSPEAEEIPKNPEERRKYLIELAKANMEG